ncbi:hypothetical protein [Nocardioides sp. AE5]|uniref:hypothetical protein n=1 Tax=Nocardioides sp. AE5 TaxID=2962573 RepID=UPI002882B4AC|nr:hypothetical protein [Nocardioides sp. AE5]MDT0202319.1 hypothetical protein [Nocardioides sp. AE5]
MGRVDPAALRDLAPQWTNAVEPHLDRAIREVAKTELVHFANFTVVAPSLASTHVVVENFMQRELERKSNDVADFNSRLVTTADNWCDAEEASTVEEGC